MTLRKLEIEKTVYEASKERIHTLAERTDYLSVLFSGMADISLNLVPYKGGAPAMTDLVGGHIQAMFAGAVPAAPHIKSGRVRALATAGSKRSDVFPTRGAACSHRRARPRTFSTR